MHTIQLAPAQWLILDGQVRPRFLIVEAPMVRRDTGETHVAWRVEWWSPDRAKRHVVAVLGGLIAGQEWCRAELEREAQSQAAISESVARKGF